MRLKLSDQAQADLKDIVEYIAQRSKNRVIGRNFTKKLSRNVKNSLALKEQGVLYGLTWEKAYVRTHLKITF